MERGQLEGRARSTSLAAFTWVEASEERGTLPKGEISVDCGKSKSDDFSGSENSCHPAKESCSSTAELKEVVDMT